MMSIYALRFFACIASLVCNEPLDHPRSVAKRGLPTEFTLARDERCSYK